MTHCAVALAHDYLTQRGGAERVVYLMARAFPDAPLYTTLHQPDTTFAAFNELDIRTSVLNRVGLFRTHHRLALPLLAPTFATTTIDADVVLVSSSGWAHGVRTTGRKVVYCHAPARWLYQRDRYLGGQGPALRHRLRQAPASATMGALGALLRTWDVRAAATAHRYLVNSTATKLAVLDAYGIESEIVAPPPALLPDGDEEPVAGVEPEALLCVARLLPYKNVAAVVAAVNDVPGLRLVVAGEGPERAGLARLGLSSGRIRLIGRVSDAQLRWLYRQCCALVAASYEDYGLSPLEAAAFGKPTLALRAGGYLDTIVEGRTGAFFDRPDRETIRAALESFDPSAYHERHLVSHAASFSVAAFQDRLRCVVAEEAAKA